MLTPLNWQTLQHTKNQNSQIMLYKIKYHLVAVDHHLTEIRNLNFFVPHTQTQTHIEAPRLILASGTSFREDLVMKLFLRPFFLFR